MCGRCASRIAYDREVDIASISALDWLNDGLENDFMLKIPRNTCRKLRRFS